MTDELNVQGIDLNEKDMAKPSVQANGSNGLETKDKDDLGKSSNSIKSNGFISSDNSFRFNFNITEENA